MTLETQGGSFSDSRADWTYQQWQDQWDSIRAHLQHLIEGGSHNHDAPFQAILYILTTVFLFLGEYSEDYQMGRQAKVQKFLTKIQNLRNGIEEDFDATKSSADPNFARKAFEKYYGWGPMQPNGYHQHMGISEILDQGVKEGVFSRDFAEGIKEQFTGSGGKSGIFLGHKEGEEQQLSSAWNDLWNAEDPSSPSSIQVVTNGLTAVSTNVSSQSSIVQSKLRFYEANDEQYKAITRSVMSSFISGEKTAVAGELRG